MFKQYTSRFWAWLYAHAKQPKPWMQELETLRIWFLNTFDPLAKHARPKDRVTDLQWNNLIFKRVEEQRESRRKANQAETRRFNLSRNWSGEISREELNSRKGWRW